MKKTGNISIKTTKNLFGLKLEGGIDLRGAEKPKIDKTASQGDLQSISTTFFSPRLTSDTWMLPRSRKMVIKWVKIYADWDPAISSILKMHARYPISEFNLVTNNLKQKEFMDAVFHQDSWDVMDTLRESATSFFRYGETCGLSEWSDKYGIWTGTTVLDPSIIEVEEIPFTNKIRVYAEIPKKYMKLWKSKDDESKEDRDRMPPEIIEVMKVGGKYIELDTEEEGIGRSYDPARCFMVTNKTDVGEDGLRGLPPIICLLRDLMYQDFLKKAQFERAKRFAYPIEFWKLGDTTKDIYPSDQDLKNVRELLKSALAAPPYSLIYSPLLSLQIVGAEGNMLNLKDDFDYVENQKLVGLGTNKNIILGEGSWLGASKTISMQRLIMDYEVDRDMWTRKVIQGHYMRALCMRHGYVKKSPIIGLTIPIIPKVNWARDLDPQNSDDTKKNYYSMWKDGVISTPTLFSKYPELDYEKERKALEQEVGTIFDNKARTLPKAVTKPADGVGGAQVGRDAMPPKPEAPVKPTKPGEELKTKDKDEKIIKEVVPELHAPPVRPAPKEKK